MKNHPQKYFDVRTVSHYLKKGLIKKDDLDKYVASLPNDENNFELTSFEDDELDMSSHFSEEELNAMPPITEDNIDNFDFLDKVSDSVKEPKG